MTISSCTFTILLAIIGTCNAMNSNVQAVLRNGYYYYAISLPRNGSTPIPDSADSSHYNTIELRGQSLSNLAPLNALSQSLRSSIEILDVSGNSLTELNLDALKALLPNLLDLDAANNPIQTIQGSLFPRELIERFCRLLRRPSDNFIHNLRVDLRGNHNQEVVRHYKEQETTRMRQDLDSVTARARSRSLLIAAVGVGSLLIHLGLLSTVTDDELQEIDTGVLNFQCDVTSRPYLCRTILFLDMSVMLTSYAACLTSIKWHNEQIKKLRAHLPNIIKTD